MLFIFDSFFKVYCVNLCLCFLILLRLIFFRKLIVVLSLIVLLIIGVFVLNFYGSFFYVDFCKFMKLIILLLNLIGFILFSNFFLLYNMLIFVGLYILWVDNV